MNNIEGINGYIYLLQIYDLNNSGHIYKVGSTGRCAYARMKEYTHGTKVLIILNINNFKEIEKKIKEAFNDDTHIVKYEKGKEYFLCKNENYIIEKYIKLVININIYGSTNTAEKIRDAQQREIFIDNKNMSANQFTHIDIIPKLQNDVLTCLDNQIYINDGSMSFITGNSINTTLLDILFECYMYSSITLWWKQITLLNANDRKYILQKFDRISNPKKEQMIWNMASRNSLYSLSYIFCNTGSRLNKTDYIVALLDKMGMSKLIDILNVQVKEYYQCYLLTHEDYGDDIYKTMLLCGIDTGIYKQSDK
jgi:hypothetical protein